MRRLLATLVLGLAAGLSAQTPATEEGRGRFCAMDIYLDSKSTPLAAYQLVLFATNGLARIVGIEGGQPAAFHEPPFYDPKAMQHDRVIIAAFSTLPSQQLPAGKTRVATIHYQTAADQPAQFELKVQTAANFQGKKISVTASFEERKSK